MGRPYDASLIPERERYYLNGGWDVGEDDDGRDTPVERWPGEGHAPQRGGGWPPVEPFDPWKNVWKLDWGPEGRPPEKPRTGYRPGWGGTVTPLSYTNSGQESGGDLRAVKEVPNNTETTEDNSASTQNADIFGHLKNAINVKRYWEEVYKEAREDHHLEHEEAVRKANEAAIAYIGYMGIATGLTGLTTVVTKNPHATSLVGFLGWANAEDAKRGIREKVFKPYNPVWDGTTSD